MTYFLNKIWSSCKKTVGEMKICFIRGFTVDLLEIFQKRPLKSAILIYAAILSKKFFHE
jgi:hypothetical protein